MGAMRTVERNGKTYWLGRGIAGEVQVYEDCGNRPAGPWGRHHTTLSDGDLTVGLVTSRRLPDAIEAMRGGSEERLAAVEAWREEQDREVLPVLLEAFPEVRSWRRSCGSYLPVVAEE